MGSETSGRKEKKYFPVLTGIVTIGLGVLLFYLVETGWLAKGNAICSVCQRPLHQAQTFTMLSRNQGELRACCPRCGLRFVIESGARELQATDFSSGKLITADRAFYLEGSDLMQCCGSATMRTEIGTVCEMHYDRCMPSLMAFASFQEAQAFQQRHGGRLIDLATARKSVAVQIGR